jgi:thiamine pyrophosphate-dependent acetolactate synthase large subunit-like protein
MEYDTFVRHKLPVISVIGNDACWSQIARDQIEILKSDCAMNLALSDYQDIGKAFGAQGARVENLEAFNAAVVEAKTSSRNGKPYLINAIIGKTDFRKGSVSM